ncbi:alpha/beta fold hydrolase BchO [Nereida sp. MMG025]|uniref:alpha/beta fold hydrolase BchO n=1 Tax=Nereida sp. MMG025 TaxID=2909981 RepID=UPI001F36E146|nr:alpha/beta fold hydrolase BchO [Nereida sp. MMG025]MCF6445999.1 alpha/beta fold hydrolase [Nereida sp. MMG025]
MDIPADWPHRDSSRFIACRPHRWHVQIMGDGPTLLLLHGAGGASHSWRDVAPLLAQTYQVIIVDLPGQGFTKLGARQRCGLDTMAEDLKALIDQEGWTPQAIVGHSAGAAVAFRLAELGVSPRGQIIGINAALSNFEGVAGFLFPMVAKLLSLNPFTARIFTATSGNRASVKRLIEGTGSHLSEDGLAQYQTLISMPSHVDATLAMMAQWKLDGLLSRLPRITQDTLLIVGDQDKAVPAGTSVEAAAKLPHARVEVMEGVGHLAHEERPDQTVDLIRAFLSEKRPD